MLQTDHRPFSFLNQTKYENGRVMRWALFLQGYNNSDRRNQGQGQRSRLSQQGNQTAIKNEEDKIARAILFYSGTYVTFLLTHLCWRVYIVNY